MERGFDLGVLVFWLSSCVALVLLLLLLFLWICNTLKVIIFYLLEAFGDMMHTIEIH
jgi:hypothetical protein